MRVSQGRGGHRPSRQRQPESEGFLQDLERPRVAGAWRVGSGLAKALGLHSAASGAAEVWLVPLQEAERTIWPNSQRIHRGTSEVISKGGSTLGPRTYWQGRKNVIFVKLLWTCVFFSGYTTWNALY